MQNREQTVADAPVYEVISDTCGCARQRAWDKPKNLRDANKSRSNKTGQSDSSAQE